MLKLGLIKDSIYKRTQPYMYPYPYLGPITTLKRPHDVCINILNVVDWLGEEQKLESMVREGQSDCPIHQRDQSVHT